MRYPPLRLEARHQAAHNNNIMEYNKDQKLGLWIFLITVIIVIAGFSMNIYYEKRLANDAHTVVCVKI